jgi:aldehyde:ferredoxin oxidoreductase
MSDYCFAGKILYVDLSERRIEIKRTQEIDSGFLGGRGLNQSILLDGQKEMISPFDQNNLLVFGAGRLVGTGAPSAVRMNVDSRNLFTGGIGSANVGGRFARELKSAGFDLRHPYKMKGFNLSPSGPQVSIRSGLQPS